MVLFLVAFSMSLLKSEIRAFIAEGILSCGVKVENPAVISSVL